LQLRRARAQGAPTLPKIFRRKFVLAVSIVLVAGAGVVARGASRRQPAPNPAADVVPSTLRAERDGFVYEFHVASGSEGLYDTAADPRHLKNVIASHRDVADACRRELEARHRVASLESLRAKFAEEIRRLRALGYL
jgi:hypothetical protein